MEQVLLYKDRINESVKAIIREMGDNLSRIDKLGSVEVQQYIQDIYNSLANIGSLADSDKTVQMNKLVTSLQASLMNIEMLGPYSKMTRPLFKLWLSKINGMTIRMDEKKGSWEVGIDYDSLSGKLGGSLKREY